MRECGRRLRFLAYIKWRQKSLKSKAATTDILLGKTDLTDLFRPLLLGRLVSLQVGPDIQQQVSPASKRVFFLTRGTLARLSLRQD